MVCPLALLFFLVCIERRHPAFKVLKGSKYLILSPARLCARLPGTGDRAACGVQGQRERGRTGRAHHDPAELPSQLENPKTSRRDIWLDQDGGWIQTEPVSGAGANAGLGLLCGRNLQPAADGATRGGLKRHPRPGETPAAAGTRGRPPVQRPDFGPGGDSGYHCSHAGF